MRLLIAVSLLLFGQLALQAQSAHRLLREGNEAYKSDAYAGAEEAYRKSLEANSTARGHYNLGNAIYQQGRYDEAVRRYEHVIGNTDEAEVRAQAYHNLGNAHFQAQDYEKSVEAFKNALRQQPGDRSAQYNLAQAQRQLKMQQQQQQQQQQNDQQNQDQQQQDQQQQQNNQQQSQQQSSSKTKSSSKANKSNSKLKGKTSSQANSRPINSNRAKVISNRKWKNERCQRKKPAGCCAL